MNYEQIYNNIISSAKQRVLEGYTEKHHIVPQRRICTVTT